LGALPRYDGARRRRYGGQPNEEDFDARRLYAQHLSHDIVETIMACHAGKRGRRARRGSAPPRRTAVHLQTPRPTAPSRSPRSTTGAPALPRRGPQARREGDRPDGPHPESHAVRAYFRRCAAREPKAISGRAGYWALDTSTPIVAGTYVAARAAVDVALTAADLVLAGEQASYGLCRPPGHHASRSMYGGYCFFNNAAIAAHWLTRRSGERVAILDLDFHHGNGTQQIFWRRADVLYVSIHADPDRHYPYFSGWSDETGEGAGAGTNINVPLRAGTGDDEYLAALDQALDSIAHFPGSLLVVSLGFDTYALDPIADFALTTPVYHEIGRRVAALGRKLVILQEGGYHRPSLGENARASLRGAEGRELDPFPATGFTPAGTSA
jgi:acetoin utilization deacetylase AcuC-like enzyme